MCFLWYKVAGLLMLVENNNDDDNRKVPALNVSAAAAAVSAALPLIVFFLALLNASVHPDCSLAARRFQRLPPPLPPPPHQQIDVTGCRLTSHGATALAICCLISLREVIEEACVQILIILKLRMHVHRGPFFN